MSAPAKLRLAGWIRWLHLYLSLVSFAALLFFSATGLTLNHPSWLGGDAPLLEEREGALPVEWLVPDDLEGGAVRRLEIVERLRSTHALQGALDAFEIDEEQCILSFQGPGYAADVIVERASGTYALSISRPTWVAYMNDLHKGRHTGSHWSLLIDVSAVLGVLVSATGLLLLFCLKKRRRTGLVVIALGTAAVVAVAWLLVP
ncbi:MAG: PepSY-associated TM helix domain-containing protein [Planctomycetes bacterium]|nr:PepSY-associated TM helix domain-containing protein [Planctomycetota bacterium]